MTRIEILEPHGLCAGVNAAIAKALTLRDVYCLHALVHNEIVIGDLKALGFRFVDRIEDVPDGATVVFSAHGVSPRVREAAAGRMPLPDVFVEPDRRAAIACALSRAATDDVVIIAGKGHETTQEVKGVKHPFDDREVVRAFGFEDSEGACHAL